MYLCDTHTHTQISFDSEALLCDMAESAIRTGLSELCITDHCDLLDADGNLDDRFDWPGSKAQFHEVLPQVEGRLTLRLGIELGSLSFRPDLARRILAEGGSEVDFVLGSIHNWIGVRDNHDLYYTNYTDAPELCRAAMENALESTWDMVANYPDCYDSLAHIIYPLRYMHRDGNDVDILPRYRDRLAEILRTVIQTGHSIEVNTCRGQTVEDWRDILLLYRDLGGTLVTTGSDAHWPGGVGKGVSEAIALLQACGFDRQTVYRRRQPNLIKF